MLQLCLEIGIWEEKDYFILKRKQAAVTCNKSRHDAAIVVQTIQIRGEEGDERMGLLLYLPLSLFAATIS